MTKIIERTFKGFILIAICLAFIVGLTVIISEIMKVIAPTGVDWSFMQPVVIAGWIIYFIVLCYTLGDS